MKKVSEKDRMHETLRTHSYWIDAVTKILADMTEIFGNLRDFQRLVMWLDDDKERRIARLEKPR